jgi:hypothetical protein
VSPRARNRSITVSTAPLTALFLEPETQEPGHGQFFATIGLHRKPLTNRCLSLLAARGGLTISSA